MPEAVGHGLRALLNIARHAHLRSTLCGQAADCLPVLVELCQGYYRDKAHHAHLWDVLALLAELLPLPDSVDELAATPALSRAGSGAIATPRTSAPKPLAPKPLAPKAAALAAQMHQTPYNNSSRRITRR